MEKEYFSEREVSQHYGISTGTLQNMRCQGRGPRYFKFGRAVRYKRADLEAFMEQGRVEAVAK